MTKMAKLRLSYAPFADLVAGLVGEPGRGYLISPTSDCLVYVRRDDPSELLAFHIEHFSESFALDVREAFEPVLGQPIMERLADLWEKISKEPFPRGLSDEEFENAVRDRRVELFSKMRETDDATRIARIHELDKANAWA